MDLEQNRWLVQCAFYRQAACIELARLQRNPETPIEGQLILFRARMYLTYEWLGGPGLSTQLYE